MDFYNVVFFGHRDFCAHRHCEEELSSVIKRLISENEYVNFYVGRNGEFDTFVSSCVKRVAREWGNDNSSLILCLPYSTADYRNSLKYLEDFYDEIEICEKSSGVHFKSAIRIRNRELIKSAELVICYVCRENGGAFQALNYAKKLGKTVINFAEDEPQGSIHEISDFYSC